MPRLTTRKAPRKRTLPLEPANVKTRTDFVRFVKQLYQSKKQDGKRKPTQWANDNVKDFLEAMLSGAGYEPECPNDTTSTRKLPRNPWTYCATLLDYGRVWE